MALAGAINHGDGPVEELSPGLEKIEKETSELTKQQQEEQDKLIRILLNDYRVLKDVQAIKKVLRLRKQFVHIHGKLGGDRTADAVLIMKAAQMAQHGLKVCILNLNFQRRFHTHTLYVFLRDHIMRETEELEKLRDRVFLRIMAEEADDTDRKKLLDELHDVTEVWPLFVITDETCKEVERIDDIIADITRNNRRFHFWSSSSFAHGMPKEAEQHNIALDATCPAPIKQVMEILDIYDDNLYIRGHHRSPLSRVLLPPPAVDPDHNIREHLDSLQAHLISHSKTHLEQDVWECKPCGAVLADYLLDVIGLGKPGLECNEVFIVGSLERFESKVCISGLQESLLEKGIMSGILFSRQTIKIQDILSTMNKVVVADAVSVRGVDKKIVIIIPSPRDNAIQERIRKEADKRQERQRKEAKEAAQAAAILDHGSDFKKPKPTSEDDEIVLYMRPLRPTDVRDGIKESGTQETRRGRVEKGEEEDDVSDDENFSEDDDVLPLAEHEQKQRKNSSRCTRACHQTALHRAINSLSKADKDMMRDIFIDAPKHVVIFHFAEDDIHSDL